MLDAGERDRALQLLIDPDEGTRFIYGRIPSDAIAFKNPNGTIVVVLRSSGFGAGAFTLRVGDDILELDIPSGGWATVRY